MPNTVGKAAKIESDSVLQIRQKNIKSFVSRYYEDFLSANVTIR